MRQDLLGKTHILDKYEVQPAGGEGQLYTIWKNLTKVPQSVAKDIVLLHDPESNVCASDKGNMHRRKMPCFDKHPIRKGIENFFDRETLEKTQKERLEFIDVRSSFTQTVRAKEVQVPESWSVNTDEKRNLCDWLCNRGTCKDFRHFEAVLQTLEQIVCPAEPSVIDTSLEADLS